MFFVHCCIPSPCLENDCHIVLHAKNMLHLRSGIKLLFPFVVDFGILSLIVILQLGSHSFCRYNKKWEFVGKSVILCTSIHNIFKARNSLKAQTLKKKFTCNILLVPKFPRNSGRFLFPNSQSFFIEVRESTIDR